jgi:nucleotide-binding universal stress UspA family protein
MGKRVLLPIDEVGHAQLACELALDLFPDATVVLLHVIDPAEASFSAEAAVPSIPDSWYETQKEHAERQFDEIEEMTDEHDIQTERAIEVGKPAQTIVDTIAEERIDHVVMGSHGRSGVSRLLLGSVAETVVRRSPAPVTVARPREDED